MKVIEFVLCLWIRSLSWNSAQLCSFWWFGEKQTTFHPIGSFWLICKYYNSLLTFQIVENWIVFLNSLDFLAAFFKCTCDYPIFKVGFHFSVRKVASQSVLGSPFYGTICLRSSYFAGNCPAIFFLNFDARYLLAVTKHGFKLLSLHVTWTSSQTRTNLRSSCHNKVCDLIT